MLLAIDTSGAETYVCIADPCKTEQPANADPKVRAPYLDTKSHSSSLSLLVKKVLSENNYSIDKLSAIILGSGPGSFTGLRIGYAFAKGLAISLDIPIFTLSSLSAVAWQYRNTAREILALDDARRGEFFAAAYRQSPMGFEQRLKDQIFSLEDIENWRKDNSNGLLVSANPRVVSAFPATSVATDLAVALAEQALASIGFADTERSQESQEQSLNKLVELTPGYIRKVAALTIEERALK